jgi:hypothetical protein
MCFFHKLTIHDFLVGMNKISHGEGCVWKHGDTCVSIQTCNLPLLEMGRPFPVLVPLPEVRNPISGTAFTARFFSISGSGAISVMNRERERDVAHSTI